jgi:FSR family fosmidomycin resistance protein-like MFS transporter
MSLPIEGLPPSLTAAEQDQTPFRGGAVAAVAAGHTLNDTYVGFVPVLLPSFVNRFSLSNFQAGWLSAFTQIPSVLQPFIGHLADRVTLRWVVTLAPGVTATLMSLVGWAPNYAALAILLMVVGISNAAFHAVGSATAGRLSGRHLGRGLSLWMVGGELGGALGPLLAGSALTLLTLKSLAWLMVLGWIGSVALYFQLRAVAMHGRVIAERPHWRHSLGRMRRVMLLMAGLVTLRSMAMTAPWVFVPILLTAEGYSHLSSGAALTLFQVSGVAGTLCAGWVSDRMGRRVVLLFGLVVGPTSLLLFSFLRGWSQFLFLATAGAAGVAMHPVSMALIQEKFPESRGLANSLYLSMSFVISSGAAILVGYLGDAIGLRHAFAVSAAVMFGAIPVVLALPADRHCP